MQYTKQSIEIKNDIPNQLIDNRFSLKINQKHIDDSLNHLTEMSFS